MSERASLLDIPVKLLNTDETITVGSLTENARAIVIVNVASI